MQTNLSWRVARWLVVAASVAAEVLVTGCTDTSTKPKGETIRIGASLPFSGKESAMGRNIEQAMLLAIDDVNKAGGISGVPLELVARDSNSGSERGLNDLLDLLYNEHVSYLIGPEENDLANEIVGDLRELDVLDILPGYAAPSSERSSSQGAWLRLAPTPYAVACGLGAHAVAEGAKVANSLYSLEDYNTSLATDFRFHFRRMGGEMKSSVTIQSDQVSYTSALDRLSADQAAQTLLIAYPAAAASLVTEWMVTGRQGHWYLSPLLRTEAFLLNIPYGALDGSFGLSPTLSLNSECDIPSSGDASNGMVGNLTELGFVYGPVSCTHANRVRFQNHFSDHWDRTRPFSAAHFYYDAVVLLAMGMQYATAVKGGIPSAKPLQQLILTLNNASNEPGYWYDLPSAMEQLANGKTLRYVGAAAEYGFNQFGVAQHRVFDTWTIEHNEFVTKGAYYAACLELSNI